MTAAARPKPLAWDELKHRLDENQPFNMMRGTPYYRDAVHEQGAQVHRGGHQDPRGGHLAERVGDVSRVQRTCGVQTQPRAQREDHRRLESVHVLRRHGADQGCAAGRINAERSRLNPITL